MIQICQECKRQLAFRDHNDHNCICVHNEVETPGTVNIMSCCVIFSELWRQLPFSHEWTSWQSYPKKVNPSALKTRAKWQKKRPDCSSGTLWWWWTLFWALWPKCILELTNTSAQPGLRPHILTPAILSCCCFTISLWLSLVLGLISFVSLECGVTGL